MVGMSHQDLSVMSFCILLQTRSRDRALARLVTRAAEGRGRGGRWIEREGKRDERARQRERKRDREMIWKRNMSNKGTGREIKKNEREHYERDIHWDIP